MELQIGITTTKSFSTVIATHGEEEDLRFNAAGYASTRPAAVKPDPNSPTGMRLALFEEVNEFLARLSLQDQEKLYDCYARIYSAFASYGQVRTQNNASSTELFTFLSKMTNKIYDIVKFDDLREYIVGNTAIKLPPELNTGYVTTDKITPLYKDRTYRLSEYIDLVAIAMGLRFMIPIWGTYLPISKTETSTNMKEYYAYKLFVGSKLAKHPALFRLETYIRANLNEGALDMSLLFNFLTSEEVPIYLMALTIIRKLSVAPLSSEISSDHLMKITHNYATGNDERLPGMFGGNIRRKTDPDSASNDDNSSVLCVYKMKESMSTGDLVIIEVFIERYQNAATTIAEDIDPAMVEKYVKYALENHQVDPRPAQMAIITWVASIVIPATAIDLFDSEHLLITMGICQAVLHHWGFIQLAVLITAQPIELEENESLPEPIRTQISKANMERLNAIYPYALPPGNKNDPVQSSNPAVRGIEMVTADLFKNDWTPVCPVELAKLCDHADITHRVEVSPQVRDELARLLIKLDEHTR